MIRYLTLGLAFLASVILSGCGGGGSSSITPGLVTVPETDHRGIRGL